MTASEGHIAAKVTNLRLAAVQDGAGQPLVGQDARDRVALPLGVDEHDHLCRLREVPVGQLMPVKVIYETANPVLHSSHNRTPPASAAPTALSGWHFSEQANGSVSAET